MERGFVGYPDRCTGDMYPQFNDVGTRTSLALNSSGYPRISYSDETSHTLKYAAWNGASWDIQTVDSVFVGGTSLALDSSGNPRIGYYDYQNGGLKYTEWNGVSWNTRTVASGRVEYPSLAIDTSDHSHIGYWDTTNHNLKYASYNGDCVDYHYR